MIESTNLPWPKPSAAAVQRSHAVVAFVISCLALSTVASAAPPTRPADLDDAEPEGDAVDWRGLERMDERGNTVRRAAGGVSEFDRLVASAPYRVQVAISDATSIRIVDGYTLERSRIYAGAKVHGYGFSSDGAWLYTVVGDGLALEVLAIDVSSAKSRRLGKLTLSAGERVALVEGGGSSDDLRVLVGIGKATSKGGCTQWSNWRRVRLRQKAGGAVQSEDVSGGPEFDGAPRKAAVSPNTKWRAEVGGGLMLTGRFGTNESKRIDHDNLPSRATGLYWMRDSKGVAVVGRRAGCSSVDLVVYRASEQKGVGWQAWHLPDDVQAQRPELDDSHVQWAPDGMRLIGVGPRGVVLIEPQPRFRGNIALIAEQSAHWPEVRPGVRSLATGAGSLRHAEILLEQGDLDAASTRLDLDGPGAPVAERKRLQARIDKLKSIRDKRAHELGVRVCELGSSGCSAAAPPAEAEPVPTTTNPGSTVAPGGAATGSTAAGATGTGTTRAPAPAKVDPAPAAE